MLSDPAQRLERSESIGSSIFEKYGRVQSISGAVVRAIGNYRIGEICSITRANQNPVLAEVVGFNGSEAMLTPYGFTNGVSHDSSIRPIMPEFQVPVGSALAGRVLNGLGQPIDGGPDVVTDHFYSGMNPPPNPMSRPVIDRPFSLGVRALDGVLTCGEGQRVGIFAAAGGGKSTLMSTLVKFSECDRCVIALIGERGREVREFVEHQLGPEYLAKSIVVVATSDRPAIEQVKAAYTATAISEYHRDRGERVLLLMDSLTRFARAQRQIGLSAGEPPTRRGFPPSVFERLPSLLERTGKNEHGSITALYTVLVEGDDMNEPIADEVRSLLDGHIVLSRKLAASGHYPAIDILRSASRVIGAVTSEEHQLIIEKMRGMLAKYEDIELLVRIGEYSEGTDPEADAAIHYKPLIDSFLKQRANEFSSYDDTLSYLLKIFGNA